MDIAGIIGQSSRAATRWDVVQWGGILMAVVILGFGGILLLRRWMRAQDESAKADPGFSLSELRAMRDRGEITPEEYEKTRAHVIAKVKAAMDRPAKKKQDGMAGGEVGPDDVGMGDDAAAEDA